MKKLFFILLAIFVICISLSFVFADDNDGDGVDDFTSDNIAQNSVQIQETQFSQKDLNKTPTLLGKLVVGHCMYNNITKENLSKQIQHAKDNMPHEVKQNKTPEKKKLTLGESFIDFLNRNPDVVKMTHEKAESSFNPQATGNKYYKLAKVIGKEIENGGQGIKKIVNGTVSIAKKLVEHLNLKQWDVNKNVPTNIKLKGNSIFIASVS